MSTKHTGMEIANGLKGLKDMFCSSNRLKKKVNKEGEQSEFEISTVAGVIRITRDREKISKKYLLFIVAITEQIKTELIR